MFHMECLPGFQLDKKSRVCECAVNRTEVLFCDPEMKFVLLQVSVPIISLLKLEKLVESV